ncbi:MAG TPA: PASTA domain-containing protein, partial [Halanaerobiales bacterium]|nr:PASTA domain-containing protein [Halanaerobiales bacterium]
KNNQQVKIPNVINKNIIDAEKELRKVGVDVKLIGMGEKVIMQIPFEDTKINKNSTVRLFTEEKLIENVNYYISVPNLKEIKISEAKNLVNKMGLKIKINGSGNTIIKQDVKPGKRVKAGSQISVHTR